MPSLQLLTANSALTQAITISAFTCEKVSCALVLSMSVKILLVSSVSHRAANYSLYINHTCFSTARFSLFLSASLSLSCEILQPMAFIKCYFLLCWELKETIMMFHFLFAALRKQKCRSCLLAFPELIFMFSWLPEFTKPQMLKLWFITVHWIYLHVSYPNKFHTKCNKVCLRNYKYNAQFSQQHFYAQQQSLT